jgi:hypothetical protein
MSSHTQVLASIVGSLGVLSFTDVPEMTGRHNRDRVATISVPEEIPANDIVL